MSTRAGNVPRPRRRWFQFGLRTLFVLMTLVALWLAWELSFIRERQTWLRENPALVDQDAPLLSVPLVQIVAPPPLADSSPAPVLADVNADTSSSDGAPEIAPNVPNFTGSQSYITLAPPPRPPREATIPFWRRLLGDEAVAEITAPDEWTDADRAHVSRLFPEAELVAPIRFGINGTVTLTADLSTTQDDSDGDMSAAEERAHAPDGSDSPPTP